MPEKPTYEELKPRVAELEAYQQQQRESLKAIRYAEVENANHMEAARDTDGRIAGGLVGRRDITESKRRDPEFAKLNRALAMLRESSHAMMRVSNEVEYVDAVCRIIAEEFHHAFVWVGYAEDDENKSVRPVASVCSGQGNLQRPKVTWAETERGPTGRAIRTGRPAYSQEIKTELSLESQPDRAGQEGYASSLALPLIWEDRAFGAVTICSRQPVTFRDEEERLLTQLADELAQGINWFRQREASVGSEQAFLKGKDELEWLVAERTIELLKANQRLNEENEERLRAEQSLRLEQARLDALLRLNQKEEASVSDIAAFVLEEGIALTRSRIGFVGFLNVDESIYTLHVMSKNVVKECAVTGVPMQWPVAEAGIWADAIREHRTLFINDYNQANVKKKDLPLGHPVLNRFMIVPFFDGKKIVAVAGVGNKASDYDKSDERQMVLLMGGMWNHVQRNLAREALQRAYDQLEQKVEHRTAQLATMNATLQQEISERKRAEEALRRSNEELEQRVSERTAKLSQTVVALREEVARRIQVEKTLRERSEQLRVMASELTLAEQRERHRMAKLLHDHLQQLLVSVKFRVTFLGRHMDPVVRESTQEIKQLLDESIEASRTLATELSPPILYEAGLTAGLQWLARWMTDKHGLFVDLTFEERIPPLVEDIKVLLFDSIKELLFNAVKHSGTGSASVALRQVSDQVQVVVADQGVGFDPKTISPAGIAGGGFGLFSIRERMDMLGGRLQIDSTPGEGSRFVLTVPLAAAVMQASPIEIKKPPEVDMERTAPVSSPKLGSPIRVLLADDHVMMREGLAQLLGQEPDIEIAGQATDGRDAVRLAGKLMPDVILMDLNMPKLNGVEATRAIHNDYPDIRIIGLSIFEESERAQALCDAGAVGYLTKSGPPENLITTIRRCMTGSGGAAVERRSPVQPSTKRSRKKT